MRGRPEEKVERVKASLERPSVQSVGQAIIYALQSDKPLRKAVFARHRLFSDQECEKRELSKQITGGFIGSHGAPTTVQIMKSLKAADEFFLKQISGEEGKTTGRTMEAYRADALVLHMFWSRKRKTQNNAKRRKLSGGMEPKERKRDEENGER